MSKQKTAPRIPLYSERREPESKDNYIYGSEDASEKEKVSLAKAMSRYLADSGPANKQVSVRMLHTLSGVSKSAIYYWASLKTPIQNIQNVL
jgi:hypothetical protein